jgi:GMP synthase-like glutamine amidotransferase
VTTLPPVTIKRNWVAIQHVPFEGPGLIAEVTARQGIELRLCHPYRGEPLPSPEELDGLVVMGGPMGVGDTAKHPHLAREAELVATMVRAGRPVLGVCLGAQLMAHSLGASVYHDEQAEIGFGTVSLTPAGREDPVLGSLGAEILPVMHWHQDTFDLPDDALWLARSEIYAHQAFRVGKHAYGLQFHLEVNRELAEAWREHLPAGVALADSSRAQAEAVGRRALEAFFEHAGA